MPTELPDHTGYLLRLLSNHVTSSFASRLTGYGTTVAEWVLMRLLFDGEGLPPSQVAVRMGLTRGGVTKIADRLIARGLLQRQDVPSDGRSQQLCLTKTGRDLVPVLADLADQNDAAIFGHLPSTDRAQLTALLLGLIHHHALTTAPID